MQEKCATILHRNPNITVARCFYSCDALSLRNDPIHICSFCACTHKEITDVHAYPDETDSRLFKKLLRYLNVASVIHHKWCVFNSSQTKCSKKNKITEPVAVPLDSVPERCTMTMKRKISTRASLIPILRPGPSLLSDTCNPQQAVRERNVGP